MDTKISRKVMEKDRNNWICKELVNDRDVQWELDNKKGQSFEIFRYTALLMAQRISFIDILEYMGYREIYVYGEGEIGQMFLSMLEDRIKVKAILDKKNLEWPELEKDDLPIIVTPAAFYQEISYGLIKAGIARERIHAIHTILSVAMKYMLSTTEKHKKKIPYRKRKHFLITGAQFTNKGAQSMLFTAASEIRKRFQDAVIWYLPVDGNIYSREIQEQYDFLFLTDGYDLKSQLYEILTELTAVIDVSGYVLSSLWNCSEWYMRMLRFTYYYGIPLFLMPQSFGPFHFSEEIQQDLKKYLSRVYHIFARESSSYEEMKKIYNLSNISLSKDLVLQNRGIEKNIFMLRMRSGIVGKYRI